MTEVKFKALPKENANCKSGIFIQLNSLKEGINRRRGQKKRPPINQWRWGAFFE